MSLVFLALLAPGQVALPASRATAGEPSWVVATIQHSEWCPAGNVRLDLETGRFAFVARAARTACGDAQLKRRSVTGTMGIGQLERVSTLARRALAEGLDKPTCRNGGRPEESIGSNGGTPLLVVTTGSETHWASKILACWTGAAADLHDALDDAFSPDRRR
jgi:hypothetical protein